MSENITVARPYSKAMFEHALASGQLQEWLSILQRLAMIVATEEVKDFIDNPITTPAQQVELLLSAMPAHPDETVKNLVEILALNKRLLLLPEIANLYENLKKDYEKTIEVKVVSYSELTSTQEEKLAQALSLRLQRKVSMEISIDPTLLGGAKISAGDLVIDGSIRGQLNKLDAFLA